MVTLPDPAGALAAALKVTVLLAPVVEEGAKLAVTPLGSPLALNTTAPANPPVRAIATVLVAVDPAATLTLAGLADTLKSAGGGVATVRLIEVARDNDPDAPVTVTTADPSVAVLEAISVSVELAPVVESGLNVAVTPVGSPLALNATLPVKPFRRVMAIALVPLAPRLIVRLAGLLAREKSGFETPVGSP
jgi:hypothetical protein